MARNLAVAAMLLAMGVFLTSSSGCASGGGGGGGGQPPGNENDNTPADNLNDNTPPGNTNDNVPDTNVNDNTPPVTLPALVKTHISLGSYGSSLVRIEAGDDLVVFADSDGIYYFTPTDADADTDTATEIPNSGSLFGKHDWKVVGRKIALVRSTNAVAIFDTETGTLTDIPGTDITLDRFVVPSDAYRPGHMTSDGDLITTINETTAVSDGNAIKVIDVSGATPEIISFPNPADFLGGFNQAAVNAETRQVAAHGTNPGDLLYVFDIDNPSAEPLTFDFFDRGGFTDNIQMVFDGDYIIYQDDSFDGDWEIALLNVAADTITVFDNNPTQNSMPVAMANGSFGYFISREDADAILGAVTLYRSAIGSVADAPDSTLADQFDPFDLRPSVIDTDGIVDRAECVANDDPMSAGYGARICVTPDGARWFLSGQGAIDYRLDYLQMSTGGRFEDFDDPEDATLTGSVMATDVSCSSNTVAFYALRSEDSGLGCSTNDEWVIGFIVLDRLE
ncbi:MAG: hypothetical protein V2A79_16780 [Planctomycetota bacterium]